MSKTVIFSVALIIIAICLLPIISVVIAAIFGQLDTLTMLANTVLLRYIGTTLALIAMVTIGTILFGTVTAWFVTTTEFWGRKILEIALIIPLAFPAYVLAYAYTDLLDHPGFVQSTLRTYFGWGAHDYWFPEIRSLGGAALMLTFVLYPYVYLLARSNFQIQATRAFKTARGLGASPLRAFISVSVPLARPSIAAGVLLVIMETLADFGTVAHFSVQTFATGIYTSWYGLADRGAAAQLALGLLAFALLIAGLEYFNRANKEFAKNEEKPDRFERLQLTGLKAFLVQISCFIPVLFGAIIPTITLILMGMESEQQLFSERYMHFIKNSVTLAGIAAMITVLATIFLVSFHRFAKNKLSIAGIFIGRLGYAVPGGVIAVGLLVPFANFDNWLDGKLESWFGLSTGLLISGSIWLLIIAYMVRFLSVSIGTYESGLSTISRNMDLSSQMLGGTLTQTIRKIHLPILKLHIFTAMLIVFVDTVKELPATLILRPFNYDTLAVQAFRLASDERLSGAAIPSLVIAAIGLIPVIILCRNVSQNRKNNYFQPA